MLCSNAAQNSLNMLDIGDVNRSEYSLECSLISTTMGSKNAEPFPLNLF